MHMARAQVSLTQVSASSGDVTMDFEISITARALHPAQPFPALLLAVQKAVTAMHPVLSLYPTATSKLFPHSLAAFPSIHVSGPCTSVAHPER